jgi:molecular chaperone DnaJ
MARPDDIFGGFADLGALLGDLGLRFGPQFRPSRGRDLVMDLPVSFDEAALGCKKQVKVARPTPCATCQESGLAPPVGSCEACAGRGLVRTEAVALTSACQPCRGKGRVGKACKACRGEGHTSETTLITVVVPAGIHNEAVLRLAGMGAGMLAGPPGDLLLTVYVGTHPQLSRRGSDIVHDVWLTPAQAQAGGRHEVPLPGEARRIELPGCLRDGQEVRVRGFGVQVMGTPATAMPPTQGRTPFREIDTTGRRGDLIVRVHVRRRRLLDFLR